MHHPRLSVNMSIDNIRPTPPLSESRSGGYLFPSSNFPLIAHGCGWKESSRVSPRVDRHPGAVHLPNGSSSHWQVIQLIGPFVSIERPDSVHAQVSPLAETVLDFIDTSHGCQGPSNVYNPYPAQSIVLGPLLDPLFKPRQV
jgi:hypothetical protein